MNGTCVDGKCECEAGYTGTYCNEKLNAAFSGVFGLQEQCTAGSDSYDVELIPDDQDPSNFKATGLWEQNWQVFGTIEQDGEAFRIDKQPFGSYEISATGNMAADGNSLDLSYQVFHLGDQTPFDVCNATLSK